jgi:hypothetical protein
VEQLDAHASSSLQLAAHRPINRAVSYSPPDISIKTMLAVLADFEPLEPTGVSTGLVAWELTEPEHVIESLMHFARQRGMISRAGWDHESGERLWRLTPRGRARLRSARR